MSDTNESPDAGDGGAPDGGAAAPESPAPEAAAPDAGAPEAGAPEAGAPDAATPDAEAPEAEAPDESPGDPAAGDAGQDAPATSEPDTGGDAQSCEAEPPETDATADTAPAPEADPAPVCAATDDHHDWIRSVLGVDPANYGTPVSAQPDADGDGPSGAPDPAADADPADAGAPPGNDGAGGAPAYPMTPATGGSADNGGDPPDSGTDANAAAAPQEEGTLDKIKDFFGVGPESDKKDRVNAAIDKVRTMSDDQIAAMSADDKAKILKTITDPANIPADGNMDPFVRGIQKRIYENTPTDPAYVQQQNQQAQQVAQDLAKDPDIQKAQTDWPTMSDADKAAALQKVVNAQAKAQGVAPPEVVVDNGMKTGKDLTVSGVYKDDGKLHINMDKDSMAANFPGAISIAAHENTHHAQDELVKQYNAGQLDPSSPAYNQARMMAINNGPNGYVQPKEGVAAYQAQPVERDAFNNGNRVANRTLQQLGGGTGP